MNRDRAPDAVAHAVRATARHLESAGLPAFAADLRGAAGRAADARTTGGDTGLTGGALTPDDRPRGTGAGADRRATSGAGRAGGGAPGLPVLRHVAAALELARGAEAAAGMAAAFDPLIPSLRWGQSPVYVAEPPNPTFLDGYAHGTLLGPASSRPLATDPEARIMLGLLLLGPHVHYPPHAHPADEVYLPLTPAHWSSGARPAGVRAPGDVLHHPPGRPHAMRTGATPLLAVYAWRGDIATPARLLRPGIVPL